MLPRVQRLRHTSEIRTVLRSGRCLMTPYVRICTRPTTYPTSRVACVVSKAIDASAVRRHWYQRRLRVIARDFIRQLNMDTSYDMVWVAQPAITKVASGTDLHQTLRPYLNKLISKLNPPC